MLTVEPLDAFVDHATQLADTSSDPVVLVNIFHVHPDHAADLEAFWGQLLRRFKSQDGFVSAQFHRGTAGSGTFLNYAVWESVEHYRRAFDNPGFTELLGGYPDGTVASPHLFTKVAVPGVCVA